MNEEQLIERLRHSLHERADGLRVSPGHLPTAAADAGVTDERAIWGPATAGPVADRGGGTGAGTAWPAAPLDAVAAGAAAGGEASGDGSSGARTAEYALLSPTGPVPVVRTGRRRWAMGATAVLAAAAAIALAVILPGRTHPVSVRPAQNSGQQAPSPTAVTVRPGPTTVTTVVPPTTPASGTLGVPVPAGFEPESVTFVSADDGWVLGWAPGSTSQDVLWAARTTDGGRTWSSVAAPPVSTTATPTAGAVGIRFANAEIGWAWSTGSDATSPSDLFFTSDAGRTWQTEANPFPGSHIVDLEISGGSAELVGYGACPSGQAGCQGQTVEEILRTPEALDSWKPAAVQPSIGAGPVLDPQLTLWGDSGWVVNDNRTTVSGARLVDGSWEQWTPPCSDANGAAILAAASATQVIAFCQEGAWGPPAAGTTANTYWLYSSDNGGASFQAVRRVVPAAVISVPPGDTQTIAAANGDLTVSFDGGSTWTTEVTEPAGGGTGFDFVGFTTATQAVAVATGTDAGVYMTYDGGHTWQRVAF